MKQPRTVLQGCLALALAAAVWLPCVGPDYPAGYFGLVLLTPILLPAALMLPAWDSLTASRKLPE